MTLQHLKRLWQPSRALFWQMLLFNALSSACGWALNTLSLNPVGRVLIGGVGLLNVAFGLAAAWALMRDDGPERPPPHDDGRECPPARDDSR
jgi:4-hydroxybenzoate polyprenyltransferase